MIPVNPEKTALSQLVRRLAANDGLNATFNAMAASANVLGEVGQLAIDFTSTPSKNFILGDVDPGDFEQTSVFRYPLLTAYAKKSENNNFQKFTTFSGLVVIGVNVFLSWRHNNALRDFETYSSLMSGAMYTVLNRSRNDVDQDWSQEVTYNGNVGLVKSSIKRDAENWFQQLAFTLVFEVDQ